MNFEELRDQWEELEAWKKILITLFFSGIIVYILYMFLLEQKIAEKDKLEHEVSKLKNEINYLKGFARPEKIRKLEEKIASVKEKIKEKEKELQKYRSVIPSKPDSDKILVYVSKVLSASDLSMDRFSVAKNEVIYAVYNKDINRVIFKRKLNKNEKGIKINKISFTVNTAGDFKGLKRFLRYLKDSKRLILVDSLKIDKKKGALLMSLEFSSYYMEGK